MFLLLFSINIFMFGLYPPPPHCVFPPQDLQPYQCYVLSPDNFEQSKSEQVVADRGSTRRCVARLVLRHNWRH
jgi:hypothetical protein